MFELKLCTAVCRKQHKKHYERHFLLQKYIPLLKTTAHGRTKHHTHHQNHEEYICHKLLHFFVHILASDTFLSVLRGEVSAVGEHSYKNGYLHRGRPREHFPGLRSKICSMAPMRLAKYVTTPPKPPPPPPPHPNTPHPPLPPSPRMRMPMEP